MLNPLRIFGFRAVAARKKLNYGTDILLRIANSVVEFNVARLALEMRFDWFAGISRSIVYFSIGRSLPAACLYSYNTM